MWQIPMKNPKIFCKGYPLWFWDSWNRALWLAEKTSHDYFWALSLVEEIAWIFLQLVRRVGVCQIWVGFLNMGTIPIIDKTQEGFVISFMRKLFATLPEWNIGKSPFHSGSIANYPIWQTPVFVNMGILPICDKSQWQTPTLLTSWRKIWIISSTNERPWNWSCDVFSANHKARFQEFLNHKGYPLQNILGFFIGICHIWGVSP